MINKKLYVFGWPAWPTSGFLGNLALFKCPVLSLVTVFFSQISIFFLLVGRKSAHLWVMSFSNVGRDRSTSTCYVSVMCVYSML